jgi:glyoxylase-like metal-dependent hydrolase (beta-lactamase superfamily II)
MRHFCGPAAILRAAGDESCDITDVVLTHTHHDHIEAVGEYPNAVVYLHQSGAAEAAPYLADRVPVTFEKTLTICDGVEIRHIGGHSVDSCIVAVQSANGEYVIVGDECYARDCLIDLRPIGSVYDREASNRFLRRYRDANVLLCHENILPDQNGFETVL